jgi:hypothetical protein
MRTISVARAVIYPPKKLKLHGLIADRPYIRTTIAVSGKSFIDVNAIACGGHGVAIAHPASLLIALVLKKNYLKTGISCKISSHT